MSVNLGAVLVTGLLAGSVSCAAVQGVLLTGLVARQRGTRQPAADATPGGSSPDQAVRAPARALVASRQPWTGRLADDLAPVGGFLAGKVTSHALLGALLGALGGAVRFAPGSEGALQLAAGALIITFGLAQLSVPGFRRVALEPPASWSRLVRGRTRSRSAFAPAALGFATVLVPCAVTLSVEALALTSGSALAGAAIMIVFVVGTGPLFVALGYAARRVAATAWRGRLAVAAGVTVLILGLLTLNDGLVLLGSPLGSEGLAQTLGLAGPTSTAGTGTAAAGLDQGPTVIS